MPKRWDALASDLDNWPRLVQIAWVYFDDAGKEIARNSKIIKPEGFIIPDESSRIHGITTEIAERKGVLLEKTLKEFMEMINRSKFLIAHNMSFDEKIIEAEFIRKKIPKSLFQPKKICTKEIATEFCKIPGSYGYKWPTLSELHIKLFDNDFQDAHNALVDVSICAKCFFELKKKGIVSV